MSVQALTVKGEGSLISNNTAISPNMLEIALQVTFHQTIRGVMLPLLQLLITVITANILYNS